MPEIHRLIQGLSKNPVKFWTRIESEDIELYKNKETQQGRGGYIYTPSHLGGVGIHTNLRHRCTFDLELVPPELVGTTLVGLDT